MRKKPDSQPDEKDFLIAYHIRELREQNFPGQGSVQKCADALGKSIQQYYTWENASRTPRGINLEKIERLHKVNRDFFSKKPDNWSSVYAQMLETWKRRVGAVTPEDEDGGSDIVGSPPTVNQAISSQAEVNAIFRLLVEKQAMAEKGEIDPDTFNERMRDLHKYMEWSFSK